MDEISFQGQTVIVTGAGGGLGRAYALEIARRGGAVVVNDLGGNVDGLNGSATMADQVVAEIAAAGGRAVANYDSVATREGAQAIAQAALSSFGRIDALINNAGNLRNAWFEDFLTEDRDALLTTHLLGTFNVTQAVWPHMKMAGYGRIVFVSSAAGMFGNQMQAGYGAAKGGVVGLMNVLAQEGEPHGILCNALLPSAMSRMAEKMDPKEMAPLRRYTSGMGNAMDPSFVAPAAVYLASQACRTTHDMYSALGGRVARAFVGIADGWIGPRDAPASVEQIAENISEIRDVSRFSIPASLTDEYRIASELMARQMSGVKDG